MRVCVSVIPAVLKPESILFNRSGCPTTKFGHDKNKKIAIYEVTLINEFI